MRKILFFLFIPLLLVSCQQSKEDKPNITVTIEPLRYFTQDIVGDKFEVSTMVPKGNSPETYEPTAQQIMSLVSSELYLKVGNLGFESTWIKRLKTNAPHLIVVDTSEGIKSISTSSRGTTDPHTWTSPANAIIIAGNIYRALTLIDSKDSLYFKANLEKLCTKILNTDNIISKKLEAAKCRSFVIYHPSLTYFSREYNLQQLAIEEDGREPSASSLKTLIEKANKSNTKLMFVQHEFSNRNTETVKKGIEAKVVEINPLNYSWHEEMINIANNICNQ